ncbi:MAG: hypothetical protein ACRD9R_22455 [Pyrinomonadaceae bacterium]
MKDYRAILEKYQFTDEHGHALEHCQDYIDLLAELERRRRMTDDAYAMYVARQVWAGMSDAEIKDAARDRKECPSCGSVRVMTDTLRGVCNRCGYAWDNRPTQAQAV